MHVFNVGSTAALGTIEFEPGLERDLPAILDKLIPPSRNYGHEQTWHDGNGLADSSVSNIISGARIRSPLANPESSFVKPTNWPLCAGSLQFTFGLFSDCL